MSNTSLVRRKLTRDILYKQWKREFSQPAGMFFGKTYFVSDSGSASYDGLTPDHPKALISAAVTLSATDLALETDRRNQIFVLGGNYDEAVVAMPASCDLIGLGGYYSGYPTNINNVWTIATAAVGTHIHGLRFNKSSSSSIISVPDGSNWFHVSECLFDATTSNDKCLEFTGTTYYFTVERCRFIGNIPYPYDIYINGNARGSLIEDNLMFAQTAAIYIATGTVQAQTVIKRNIMSRHQGDTGAQLAVGIHFAGEGFAVCVGNWISAVDAIYPSGSGDIENMLMDNSIVQAKTADRETTYE